MKEQAASSSGGCASDELNPLNRMPAVANQQRADGQEAVLSTERVESTIPTGSAEGTKWVYPSPQMFYNALVRKGKSAGVEERNMDAVVAIHNNMNEMTWRQVLEWESLHDGACAEKRKLLRFVGRPDELSPKAAAQYYLGLKSRPFDRHDWTVDRCGQEVRYIIDYYDIAARRADDRLPTLHDTDAVPSIECDVRPAGDTLGALADRARMMLPGSRFPEPKAPTTANDDAAAAPAPADVPPPAETAAAPPAGCPVASSGGGGGDRGAPSLAMADVVRDACAEKMAALQACDGERECAQAHIGLTFCIAQHVCAEEAKGFAALKGSDDHHAQAERYEKMEACVGRWGEEAAAAAMAASR